MKTLITSLHGLLALPLLVASKVFAQIPDPVAISGLPNATTVPDIKALIVRIIETILDFVLLVAVIFIIIAGIRLIISGGDEGQKDKAKTTIIYVIIGIVVILFARAIVIFVNSLFP